MKIEPMREEYREEIQGMMRVFYASPAVLTNGSEEIFRADIDVCLSDEPWLEGYVFVEAGELIGYTMLASGFSTEYGRRCIWIEDLYFKPEYRGKGYGSLALDFIHQRYPEAILRLEVEEENRRAIHVYRKNGFDALGYLEMKR